MYRYPGSVCGRRVSRPSMGHFFLIAAGPLIWLLGPSRLLAAQVSGDDQPTTQPTTKSVLSDSGDAGLTQVGQSNTAGAGAELLLFQDLPVVVSASRQAQPINQASESISVISANDIHYSARTTLPEILQFTPGVDVTKLDRNDYAVGVFGLHSTIADRTLTLIDGRDAGTPEFGDADFLALPIFLEDIQRIEVVRGPGGAAWGANALNGVINIITKPLEDTTGFLASSTVDEYGDTYNQLRLGAVSGPLAWRVSTGYENRQSSEQALDGNTNFQTEPGLGPFLGANTADESGDSAQNVRLDVEGSYKISDQSKLTVGVADATERRGSYEFLGELPPGYTYLDVVRDFARMDFNSNANASGYVQVYNNYENSDSPSLAEGQTDETDLETQWNFSSSKENKLTAGGNIRDLYSDFPMNRATDLVGGTFSDYTGGVFLIDRWQMNQRIAIEGQIRGDYYSESGADWSGRLSALYSPDDSQRQVFRLSVARAFRDPLSGTLGLQGQRLALPSPPFPAGSDAIHIVQNPDLDNEHVYAIECGYDGQIADGLTFRMDPFFQQYQGLIGAGATPTPPGGFGAYTQLQNIGGGQAYGLNTELDCTIKSVTCSLWYGLDQFIPEMADQDTRSFRPAEHQAGVNARWSIGSGWTMSGNYKFTDVTRSPGAADSSISVAPASNQVDLTLAKSLFNGNGEVSVGVADLFNQTRAAVAEEGQFTAHDTPGRTIMARFQWRW